MNSTSDGHLESMEGLESMGGKRSRDEDEGFVTVYKNRKTTGGAVKKGGSAPQLDPGAGAAGNAKPTQVVIIRSVDDKSIFNNPIRTSVALNISPFGKYIVEGTCRVLGRGAAIRLELYKDAVIPSLEEITELGPSRENEQPWKIKCWRPRSAGGDSTFGKISPVDPSLSEKEIFEKIKIMDSISSLIEVKRLGKTNSHNPSDPNDKHLKRTGWVRKGISEPETVSGHMYRMAILSFLFDGKDGIDTNRVLQMSLVHDMAESLVGDITPHCGVSEEEKHSKEVAAMSHIKSLVGETAGQRLFNLFMEYEEQKSAEALLVKDLDKFDMILQAFEYEERDGEPSKLNEFFASTEGKFKHPKVLEWVAAIKEARTKAATSADS